MILALAWLLSFDVRASGCTPRPCDASPEYLGATRVDGAVVEGFWYRWNSFAEEFQLGLSFDRVKINGQQARPGQLTTRQFVQSFEAVLARLHAQGRRVDSVSLRMDAVDELWSQIRAAVRKAARAGKGPLLGKDEATTRAMRRAIRDSGLVKQTCEAARRQGTGCDPKIRTGTNEIAFVHDYGSDRERMLKAPDVGMLPGMGVEIHLTDVPRGASPHASG